MQLHGGVEVLGERLGGHPADLAQRLGVVEEAPPGRSFSWVCAAERGGREVLLEPAPVTSHAPHHGVHGTLSLLGELPESALRGDPWHRNHEAPRAAPERNETPPDQACAVEPLNGSRRWRASVHWQERSPEPPAYAARELPISDEAGLHERLTEHPVLNPPPDEGVQDAPLNRPALFKPPRELGV